MRLRTRLEHWNLSFFQIIFFAILRRYKISRRYVKLCEFSVENLFDAYMRATYFCHWHKGNSCSCKISQNFKGIRYFLDNIILPPFRRLLLLLFQEFCRFSRRSFNARGSRCCKNFFHIKDMPRHISKISSYVPYAFLFIFFYLDKFYRLLETFSEKIRKWRVKLSRSQMLYRWKVFSLLKLGNAIARKVWSNLPY